MQTRKRKHKFTQKHLHASKLTLIYKHTHTRTHARINRQTNIQSEKVKQATDKAKTDI